METVYVVIGGPGYTAPGDKDIRVVGGFSTRDLAEKVAMVIGNPLPVVKLIIDGSKMLKKVQEGLNPFYVQMRRDGSCDVCRTHIYYDEVEGLRLTRKRACWPPNGATWHIWRVLNGIVWAKDAAHAEKRVELLRKELVIGGRWPKMRPVSKDRKRPFVEEGKMTPHFVEAAEKDL